jgi:arylsulfatase A-like enzyme
MAHAEPGPSLLISQEPMITTRFEAIDHAVVNGSAVSGSEAKPLALMSTLLMSAWCGLVAGLLEVGTIVVRKSAFDANHLYGMSRHFVWLVPVTNLCVFLALGMLGWIVGAAWPRRGRWTATRGLCAVALLPMVLIAFPRIYTVAWLVVTLGIAARLVPVLEANSRRFRRAVGLSFPMALGILLFLAASPWVNDRIKRSRESAQPPPQGSPNVLLIVLDTVAAGHLSLYGYERPTSTTLVELAERGFRFDSARAPSSWTLPSHATIFTGRWMHELSVGWLNPLDEARPTLAEYLGARGYATAGFVANTMFCASDTGLGRGFTRYEDFIFPECTALKSAVLANRVLTGFGRLVPIVAERPSLAWLRPHVQHLWERFVFDRKGSAAVNREFLGWLSGRTQPQRPFFAFLNYSDAHTPYELADGRIHRFGVGQLDERQRELIKRWGELDKVRIASRDLRLVVDAYDECVADLDEQIGRLLDRLSRRGVLDRTWLVIASDHGESFGEHAGVFCHGTSLYRSELHVPLLIIPPGGSATKKVITETVSLRDLAATIVDVLGVEAGSPFPGSSLARYWREQSVASPLARAPAEPALAEVVPGFAINVDAYGLPQKSWPLGALDDGAWSFIRSEGNVHEELFHRSTDKKEQRNLALNPAAQPVLDRMRQTLLKLTGGPLIPQRFNR